MKKSPLGAIFLFILFVCPAAFGQAVEPTPRAAEPAAEQKDDQDKPKKYEVQVQLSTESLTRGFGVWRSAAVYAQRRFTGKRIVWGMYRVSDRKGNRDQEFVGGMYQPLKNRWAMTGEGMYSPSGKYVGKFSAMFEVEKAVGNGYVAHGGTRFTKYRTVTATTGYGLLEKYWGSNRLAYTLYLTRLSNAGTAPTHRLQYNRYYGERVNTFGAAISFGKEHENLGPNVGILRTQTWSASVSARHWFTDKLGMSIDATYHRQGKIYDRRGVTIGIRYRF